MACRVGIGLTAKSGGNLAQPFPSVKKDAFKKICSLIKAPQKLQCDGLLLLNDRVDRTEMFQWQDA
jgi:hypothetical protein